MFKSYIPAWYMSIGFSNGSWTSSTPSSILSFSISQDLDILKILVQEVILGWLKVWCWHEDWRTSEPVVVLPSFYSYTGIEVHCPLPIGWAEVTSTVHVWRMDLHCVIALSSHWFSFTENSSLVSFEFCVLSRCFLS